jgi:hypothetical protein
MKLLLVASYTLLAYGSSLDMFAGADFMYAIFFSASCCILCALIARHVPSLFAELFVLLQAVALVLYALMSASYLWLDASYMVELNNINTALLIADIIALAGVMLGDRWLYSRAG